jgi:UDP-glucose 4-epimerase
MSTEGQRILVTGGAGAIGSSLIREIADTNQVVVLDNFSSGRRENLEGVRCTMIEGDIADADDLKQAFEGGVDVVIHLAAHFANQNSLDHPLKDAHVNIGGTINLLERSRQAGGRFVLASSSCVYGAGSEPFREDESVTDLHTPYAVSKYSAERYARFYQEHYGLDVVILRFFNNFGPFDPPGQYRNVLPNFLLKATRGEDIPITGSGQETRDFNYCSNTVSAVLAAATAPYEGLLPDPVFNVGSGVETTIHELAEMVVSATRSKSKIVFKDRRGWDHTSRRCADISKARSALGYEPKIDLADGLEMTVSWFNQQDWSGLP